MIENSKTMYPKRVCMIIPTYNSWLITVSMIRSILNYQSFRDITIVVIDAGSEDYLKLKQEFDKEIREGKIVLIHTERDLGGSGSFYVGLKYCLHKTRCDIIILSDNDAIPLSNTLVESLVMEASKRNNVVVRPRNLNYDFPNWFLFHFITIPRECAEKIPLDSVKDYFVHNDDYAFIAELKLHGCEIETIDEWYSHPMRFPRIYYYLRNIVFQYIHRPNYGIKLQNVVQSFLSSLIQASYIMAGDALKAVLIGLLHGIRGHLGKGPDTLAKLSLVKFGKHVESSYVDVFVFASRGKPKCKNLRTNAFMRYVELPLNSIANLVRLLIKFRNKVVAVDVGFTIFSMLLLIAKKVVYVVYNPTLNHCELREYTMSIRNKLLAVILSIILIPLVMLILLLAKVCKASFRSPCRLYGSGR